ncbi:hypothetical protein ABPG72_009582 [Tetrahymena utriculariae]
MSQYSFKIFKGVFFTILLICVNRIGCPFWQSQSSNRILPIQRIILLKSNPQNEKEDITVLVLKLFSVGLFSLVTNQQHELVEKQEAVKFYQVDKDNRSTLKIQLLDTLDASGRVIDWNPFNGLKQNVIQIPKNISFTQDSCLNSQEKLVFTWNTTHIFVIDFAQQLNQNQGIFIQKINSSRQLVKCVNDKPNRRFLIIDSQGGILSYDIQSQSLKLLIQLNQLQSNYASLNQIKVFYLKSSNLNFVVSYKNSQLEFQQQIKEMPAQVLTSNKEDQSIVIGLNNLFQVWQIKQACLSDFQSIYCDFRDSNSNKVDTNIKFKFRSVKKQKQLSSDQTISTLDKITQRFNYVTNYFVNTQTNYDSIVNIEINVDLNRIILINISGSIYIWSFFDGIFEKIIQVSYAAFPPAPAESQQNIVTIIDYRIGAIKPIGLVGYGVIMTQYMIFRFQKGNNHNLILNGTLLQNTNINLEIKNLILMEIYQQILLQFSNQIFLFNYFYIGGQFNDPILIQGLQNPIQYYYFNKITLSLYAVQQSQILIYSFTQNQQYNNEQDLINSFLMTDLQNQSIHQIEQINVRSNINLENILPLTNI